MQTLKVKKKSRTYRTGIQVLVKRWTQRGPNQTYLQDTSCEQQI